MTDERPVRKRHYVDQSLQRHLIIGLIVLESLLLILTLFWLNGRMESLIEEQIFRVHQLTPEPLLIPLLKEVAVALGIMLAVNALLLLAAEALWTRHVNRLLAELRPLLARSEDLDFRPDAEPGHEHTVIELARAWRSKEATRLAEIRATIQALDPHWLDQDQGWQDSQHKLLSQLHELSHVGHPTERPK